MVYKEFATYWLCSFESLGFFEWLSIGKLQSSKNYNQQECNILLYFGDSRKPIQGTTQFGFETPNFLAVCRKRRTGNHFRLLSGVRALIRL